LFFNTQKTLNKTTLKFELDLDFKLLAISSQLKDYVFCFKINKQLSIDFCKISDLELPFNGGNENNYFSRYYFLLPDIETEFYIVANKGSEGFLIPEMKKADFFILIRNYIDQDELKQFIMQINKIPEVLAALEVDPKKLKSKENLIF
jgi:hypothetical protein